jgi:hypothetical protein
VRVELHETERLKSIIARDALLYLCSSEEEEKIKAQQLRAVCSGLARLLGHLLQGSEGWSPYYWVDDVLPTSESVDSRKLEIQGSVVWGELKQSRQWQAPFVASLRIPETENGPLLYELKFGDKQQGLRKLPYATRAKSWRLPEEWFFELSDPPSFGK